MQENKVTPGTGIRIRQTGTFDLNKLYKDLKAWFDSRKYFFQEKEHAHKSLEKGDSILIRWEAEREIDEYAKFIIKIKFYIENIKKQDGLDKGKIEIITSASVGLDYKNHWQSKPLGNFLFPIYNKYIIKNKIKDYYEKNLYSEVLELNSLTKSILNLYV